MNGEALQILLVEDNDDHAEIVMRGLANHPLPNQIHRVSDGEAALAYLFRSGNQTDAAQNQAPKLVLLDLRLPKVDGLEVLRRVKESPELRRIPVVILTTSAAENDVAQAYDRHANSYLVKSVDFACFNEMMDSLAFYWLAWNRKPPLRGDKREPHDDFVP